MIGQTVLVRGAAVPNSNPLGEHKKFRGWWGGDVSAWGFGCFIIQCQTHVYLVVYADEERCPAVLAK